MSTRLTNTHRNQILRKLVEKAYSKKDATLEKENQAMFLRLVKDWHRDHLRAMSKMPVGAFRVQNSLTIKFRNNKMLTLGLTKSGEPPKVFNSFPSARTWEGVSFSELQQALSPEVKAALEEFQKKVAEHEDNKKKFEADTTAVLASVTTFNKLYEIWPELAKVVPLIETPPGAMGKQLAPNMTFLNSQLGINDAVPAK